MKKKLSIALVVIHLGVCLHFIAFSALIGIFGATVLFQATVKATADMPPIEFLAASGIVAACYFIAVSGFCVLFKQLFSEIPNNFLNAMRTNTTTANLIHIATIIDCSLALIFCVAGASIKSVIAVFGISFLIMLTTILLMTIVALFIELAQHGINQPTSTSDVTRT